MRLQRVVDEENGRTTAGRTAPRLAIERAERRRNMAVVCGGLCERAVNGTSTQLYLRRREWNLQLRESWHYLPDISVALDVLECHVIFPIPV